MDHAAAGMDDRKLRLGEVIRRAVDEAWRGLQARSSDTGAAVAACRIAFRYDRFGHVEVHDTWFARIAGPKCRAGELWQALRAHDCFGPLGHGPDHPHLIEGLIRPTTVGGDDLRPAAAREQKHSVAFTVFHRDTGEHVGDPGPIAREADAEATREPGVGTAMCIR
jgi:hypothetical protein